MARRPCPFRPHHQDPGTVAMTVEGAAATWQALEALAGTSPPVEFDGDPDQALPEPTRRWFRRALPTGTPLSLGVRLEMTGRIKIGRWWPFTAAQILVPGRGFV